MAALVRAALGSLQLAHAEAAAQEARHSATPGAAQPDPRKPHETRHQAASILLGASQGMTPPVSRALASQGLVGPLLQVGFRVDSEQTVYSTAGWSMSSQTPGPAPTCSACWKLCLQFQQTSCDPCHRQMVPCKSSTYHLGSSTCRCQVLCVGPCADTACNTAPAVLDGKYSM